MKIYYTLLLILVASTLARLMKDNEETFKSKLERMKKDLDTTLSTVIENGDKKVRLLERSITECTTLLNDVKAYRKHIKTLPGDHKQQFVKLDYVEEKLKNIINRTKTAIKDVKKAQKLNINSRSKLAKLS